jgi:oxalate decarboxylase family bicupin protein
MRLAPYAYRELHWHTANEWSLVLKGSVRLAAVEENGRSFIDDIGTGDVWFFPAGVPHPIQALDEGCEFLLVFHDGSFSEDSTFLASELFMRNPKEVLSKNLQTPISAFDNLPTKQLYIFNGSRRLRISQSKIPLDQPENCRYMTHTLTTSHNKSRTSSPVDPLRSSTRQRSPSPKISPQL